jgi:hypothetical protein
MARNFKNISLGMRLVPHDGAALGSSGGDFDVTSSNGKANYYNAFQTSSSPIVTESHSATLINKTLDADNNTISNLVNANFKSSAALDRSKIAAGSASHVVVNDGSGLLSSVSTLGSAYIQDSAITTSKIEDLAVTTGKLANNAVTQAKRAALGQQLSDSCGTFYTSSTSLTDITNLSVSLTTTGRPVYLALIPDGTSSNCFFDISFDDTYFNNSNSATIAFLRGSTVVGRSLMLGGGTTTPTGQTFQLTYPGGICVIDVPSAGTYTYKAQLASGFGDSVGIVRMKLIAFEL